MIRNLLGRILLTIALVGAIAPARAQFADQSTWGGTSTGSANAYAITIDNWTVNLPGVPLRFLPSFTNTGAATLNVSGLGNVSILKVTPQGLTTLSAGDLLTGSPPQAALVMYDGTEFVLFNPTAAKAPTVQRFTSGTGTYTPTSGTIRIRVRMCGGGGGGGATITNNGTNGGDTSFGSWTAIHGVGAFAAVGAGGTGGTGGVNGTGTVIFREDGGKGGSGWNISTVATPGAAGGISVLGGAGQSGAQNAAGQNAATNSCSGGSGAGASGAGQGGGGGGAGEYVEFYVFNPTATGYAVGALGTGGAAGTNAGGNGGAGIIIIEELYSFLLRRDLGPANNSSPMWLHLAA